MVRVATAADVFEAKLLAARLGAEGILWEFRGNVDGMYPIGPFDVLVEPGQLETARLLLDPAGYLDGEEDDTPPPRWSLLFVGLVVAALMLFVIVRMFSIG